MKTKRTAKPKPFRIHVKRSAFTAKVYLAPGLVVTLRGGVRGKTRDDLIREAWETVHWAANL